MQIGDRIERALVRAIGRAAGAPGQAPAGLARALDYAVTPGGARIRPTILVSVAMACSEDRPAVTDAAATALELIHCASLVHDDLPAFDDAETRRGKPSLHRAFGEPVGVLAGDSLIVLAFEALGRLPDADAARALRLIRALSRRTGMPYGICAGQGWESEPAVDLALYHRAKTGALFMAATEMGAIAAGEDPDLWTELGARIGEAFQVADDLKDALEGETATGKTAGQDARHGRPNAVLELGVDGAVGRLNDILGGAIASIPSCPGEGALAHLVRVTADRIVPVSHRRASTIPGE